MFSSTKPGVDLDLDTKDATLFSRITRFGWDEFFPPLVLNDATSLLWGGRRLPR